MLIKTIVGLLSIKLLSNTLKIVLATYLQFKKVLNRYMTFLGGPNK